MHHQSTCPLESNLLTSESNEVISESGEFTTQNQKIHVVPKIPEVTRIMLESIVLKNASNMNSRDQHDFLRIMNELLDLTDNIR